MGSPDPGRRRGTWAFLVLALMAGAASVLLRVVPATDGARAGFYAGAWGPTGITIDPLDGPAAGLLAGDTVVGIGGGSMDDWVRRALDPAAARPGAGDALAYDLRRAGEPVTATVRWTTGLPSGALGGGWGVALFSVAFIGVAAFVLRRRPDEPAATALVIAAAAAGSSSLPWFLGVTTSDVVRGLPFVLQSLVTGPLFKLLWPATVHRASPVPGCGQWGVPGTRRVLATYLAPMGAYGVLMVVSGLTAPSALAFVGSWPLIQVLVLVPCLLVATGMTARTWLRATDPAVRARIGLVAAAFLVSTAFALALFWLPVLLIGRALAPDGALGLVALPVPLAIGAAILRNRLFDIDAALNRTLVYGALTVGVLATYVLATAAMTLVAGSEDFSVSLLATGIAALLALPLRDGLQGGVDRLLYGRRREPMTAIRQLGLQLSFAADPARAVPAVAETLRDVLRVPYAAVEVDRGDEARLAAASGSRPSETVSIPLAHGGTQVGRIVVGTRPGERGFRDDERALLDELARQAGTAIAALGMREDLDRSRERQVLAREEERRRLRRDLHDGLGPTLAAVAMRADAAAALVETDPAAAQTSLEALGEDVRTAFADVRRLVDGLRPPALDELGLVGAIRHQVARLEGDGAVRGAHPAAPRIAVVGPADDCLPALAAAVEVAAYRIAVEAVTNVVRHARAAACTVRITAGDRLEIDIADDGAGMPADVRAGVGLESMRVRAAEVGGEVLIESSPGGGTRVTARLPFQGPGREAASEAPRDVAKEVDP